MSTTSTQPKSPPSADNLTAVPRGYKRTEVGVIPEDWVVNKLDNLCFSIVDGTHYTPKYINEGIPFFSVENVTSDNFSNTKFISQKDHDELTKRCKPEKGDILLTRIGSLGKTKLIDWDVNASIYVSLALMKLNNRVLTDFLYRYSESSQFIADVEKRSLLNAIPMKINMGNIGDIPIPVPSFPEQRAIATVLNDMDALITSLDNLIAKKRLIKQGAMQQLLTGKTRLQGFANYWKTRTFNELFQFLKTANNPRKDLSEKWEIKYIHYGDIHTRWKSFLDCEIEYLPSIENHKVRNVPLLENGDLVMADASEDYSGIGVSVEVKNVMNKKVVAGLHTLLLRGNKELLADGFKGYLQYIPSIKDALIRVSTGISVYAISKTNIKNISVCLPDTLEQRAIAEILIDMDAEIAALEKRCEKTKLLKQGMMQELLTGKTRLI